MKNIKSLFKKKNMKPEETKIEEKEELNNSEDMSAENLNDAIEDKKKNEKKSKNSEKDKVQELGEKLAELNDKYLRLYS